MHIPDGFLDTKTWISLTVVSVSFVGLAVTRANKKIDEKHIPVLGVMSAFVFAAQMVNFPVGAGTSGHFVGAALISIILGPFSGVLAMTTVLIVQCLVFQDGGLTALGANIFNMGILGSFVSYYIYAAVRKIIPGKPATTAGSFIAAWFSIVLGAAACAVELGVSGTVPLKPAFAAMVAVHSIIGIFEGVITAAILIFLSKVRRDLLTVDKI